MLEATVAVTPAEMQQHSATMLQRFDTSLAETARDHANFMRIFESHELRITSLERESSE